MDLHTAFRLLVVVIVATAIGVGLLKAICSKVS